MKCNAYMVLLASCWGALSVWAGEKGQARTQMVSWDGKIVLWMHAAITQGLIYCAPSEWENCYEHMALMTVSAGMGCFLGALQISRTAFIQALPVYSLGTLGAVAGRYGSACLGLSDEQTSLLATAGACAGGGVGYGIWRGCSQLYQRRQKAAWEKRRAAELDRQYKRAQEEVALRNLVEESRRLNDEMEEGFRKLVGQPD